MNELPKNLYNVHFSLEPENLKQFLDAYEEIHNHFVEMTVEASEYREAKTVIDFIRGLK